jgi:hypothetical protein
MARLPQRFFRLVIIISSASRRKYTKPQHWLYATLFLSGLASRLLYTEENNTMTVTALSPQAHAIQSSRAPEAAEGSKPDRDGDADDSSVGATASSGVSASAPKGMGGVVDTRA